MKRRLYGIKMKDVALTEGSTANNAFRLEIRVRGNDTLFSASSFACCMLHIVLFLVMATSRVTLTSHWLVFNTVTIGNLHRSVTATMHLRAKRLKRTSPGETASSMLSCAARRSGWNSKMRVGGLSLNYHS